MAEVEIFKLFLLVMVRFGGLMTTAPVLGSGNFPALGKVGLTALMAMLVTPAIAPLEMALPSDPLSFGIMAIGELLIGLMIGFVMTIFFSSVQLAGQIIDMQTGFGMMNVFNPAMETQFPIFGFFLFIIAVLYFLALNLHHIAIAGLVRSFDTVPVGGFMAQPELLYQAARWGSAMFVDGLMISAPIAAAMLLAYVTMGLLGRVVPQIHLFVVGFPVTIATGLLIMALIIGVYLQVMDRVFEDMYANVTTMIRQLG